MNLEQELKRPIKKSYLADNPNKGYNYVLELLNEFYSPIRSDRGANFRLETKKPEELKVKQGIKNELYLNETNKKIANINIVFEGTTLDNSIEPPRLKQNYTIYFNSVNPQYQRETLQNKNAFLDYIRG